MSIVELLQQLSNRDIRIWLEGDRIRVNAPEGALTAQLREQIQSRKPEIIAFLRQAEEVSSDVRAIVPLQTEGDETPLFGVAGHNGDVFCYRAFAQAMAGTLPIYGLQPRGLDGQSEPFTRIDALVQYFADQIQRFRPTGPVRVSGFCAGGTVAFALTRELLARGREVPELWLFGAPYPTTYRGFTELAARVSHIGRVASQHARAALANPVRALDYLREVQQQRRTAQAAVYADVDEEVVLLRQRVEAATLAAVKEYDPLPLSTGMCLFLPAEDWRHSADQPMSWRPLAATYSEKVGPSGCNGDNMLRPEYAPVMADLARQQLWRKKT